MEYVPGIPILKPSIDADNKPFWDAVANHELVLQKCGACDIYYQPPRPMCAECKSMDTMEWVPSSGRGHIYSYVNFTTDRMAYPAMKVPYSVVLVELEEGIRLVSNLMDIEPDEVEFGMPVEVVFDDISDDLTLYKFKRRAA
ncbi:MAG: Zn-ribbon domain-containing OB-fold protein [Acidimicrobiia bacterium]